MALKPINLDLASRLTNRKFRERFLSTLARDEIAAQIRQLRLKRGFTTQSAFAKETGMQQSAVSRIEQADYSGWTFRTLLKVAFALKARLRVTFEPIEIVIDTAKRSERVAALQAKTDDDIATARADVDDFNTVPHDIVDEDMPWPNTTVVHNDNATQVSQ
jgi:transcriptional regulator with XRE-family HTH domain